MGCQNYVLIWMGHAASHPYSRCRPPSTGRATIRPDRSGGLARGPPLGCNALTLPPTSSRRQPLQIRMTFWHPTGECDVHPIARLRVLNARLHGAAILRHGGAVHCVRNRAKGLLRRVTSRALPFLCRLLEARCWKRPGAQLLQPGYSADPPAYRRLLVPPLAKSLCVLIEVLVRVKT